MKATLSLNIIWIIFLEAAVAALFVHVAKIVKRHFVYRPIFYLSWLALFYHFELHFVYASPWVYCVPPLITVLVVVFLSMEKPVEVREWPSLPKAFEPPDRGYIFQGLYATQMEKFHQSRNIEWYVNISLWTMIAVLTTQLGNFYIDFDGKFLILSALTLIHAFWMFMIQTSQNMDIDYALHYRAITEMCGGLSSLTEDRPHQKSNRDWIWILLPVAVTSTLLTIVLFVLKQPIKT